MIEYSRVSQHESVGSTTPDVQLQQQHQQQQPSQEIPCCFRCHVFWGCHHVDHHFLSQTNSDPAQVAVRAFALTIWSIVFTLYWKVERIPAPDGVHASLRMHEARLMHVAIIHSALTAAWVLGHCILHLGTCCRHARLWLRSFAFDVGGFVCWQAALLLLIGIGQFGVFASSSFPKESRLNSPDRYWDNLAYLYLAIPGAFILAGFACVIAVGIAAILLILFGIHLAWIRWTHDSTAEAHELLANDKVDIRRQTLACGTVVVTHVVPVVAESQEEIEQVV